MEKSAFVGEEAHHLGTEGDLFVGGSFHEEFPPGTFVEIRRNQVVTYGVILQLPIIKARQHAMTLTYTGEIWPHLAADITYSIPSFVSQDLIYRSGTEYEAADVSQTVARLEIVEQIRTFARRHEHHFNAIGKTITKFYDAVRHPDPECWSEITTAEAVRHLDVRKPPPILTLFGMHSHLMQRSLYFVADPRNHKSTHRFSVRPLSHVKTILEVNEWVRGYDPVLLSFLSKARAVIRKARQLEQKNWKGAPVPVDSKFEPWTPTDLVFIRYLQQSLRTTRTIQRDPYDNSLPNIIKRLRLYDEEVTPGLTHKVLRELGAIAPWEDIVTRTPELGLDIAPPGMSKQTRIVDELVGFNISFPGKPVPSPLQAKLVDAYLDGSTELYEKDPHASIRHDFGNLPVYVIDDAAAQELDDGLSIEAVASELGNYWVHVHVADPTTLIPPGHVLDLRARSSAVTMYTAHRTWPMLPPSLTHPLFSLGSKPKGTGQPVLTFSIKLSESGDILDYKVRAARVRNVQILHYSQVDRLLNIEHPFRSYPLVEAPVPAPNIAPIAQIYHSDLQKLYDIADAIALRSVKENPILFFSFPTAQVQIDSELPLNSSFSTNRPILWKGFPQMTYFIESFEDRNRTSCRLVAEYMKLACRVASRFCIDKGIPALRRASTPLYSPIEKDMEDVLALRNPYGDVSAIECIKRDLYAPPGEPSLEPLEHWSLAVPKGEGYSRVTSPLRRYSDLLVHWQIKHALLPASKRTTPGPLFPAEFLKPIMYRLFEKEKALSNVASLYQRHWALTYLSRYVERRRREHGSDYECFPDLKALTLGHVGFDTRLATGQVPVLLPSLGVRGLLKGLDSKVPIPIGTTLSVKITQIQLGLTPLIILDPA
ncbi:RNB-domain-containing protein [Ramaria rubella]|nr:RNB-domain-containing protein [Ramaria rubella]